MPAGRLGSTWLTAASTSSVLAIMSRPQPKSIEICAEPRVVSERTSCTPGTVRIASSTGRVTSSAVWSAGRLPASRSTTTRGNETCGNSPTGSDSAETRRPPPAPAPARRWCARAVRRIAAKLNAALPARCPRAPPCRPRAGSCPAPRRRGSRRAGRRPTSSSPLRADQRDVHAHGLAVGDLEHVGALAVDQHRVVRHDPAGELAHGDRRPGTPRRRSRTRRARRCRRRSAGSWRSARRRRAAPCPCSAAPPDSGCSATAWPGCTLARSAGSMPTVTTSPSSRVRVSSGAPGCTRSPCATGIAATMPSNGAASVRIGLARALAPQRVERRLRVADRLVGLGQLVAGRELLREQLRGVGALGAGQGERGDGLLVGAGGGRRGAEVEQPCALAAPSRPGVTAIAATRPSCCRLSVMPPSSAGRGGAVGLDQRRARRPVRRAWSAPARSAAASAACARPASQQQQRREQPPDHERAPSSGTTNGRHPGADGRRDARPPAPTAPARKMRICAALARSAVTRST